jgi:hypothetical protein
MLPQLLLLRLIEFALQKYRTTRLNRPVSPSCRSNPVWLQTTAMLAAGVLHCAADAQQTALVMERLIPASEASEALSQLSVSFCARHESILMTGRRG